VAGEWMVVLVAEDSEVEIVGIQHIDPIIKVEQASGVH